jgi:hypothetical protein
VTCPDWRALIAEREREPGADPPGWAEARAHLAVCAGCRARAIDLDPSLLLVSLPAPRVAAADVADMQRAVAALVRAGRVEPRPRRLARQLWRGAAAAAVVLLALAVEAGPRRAAPEPVAVAAALTGVETDFGSPPVLEELDRPEARVYQLPAEGLSVVMIVDASLDV